MKLTKIERLLISNQFRILSLLDETNKDQHILNAEITEHGYEGFYDEIFEGIYDGISEEVCEETVEMLNMFRTINNYVDTLTDEQKKTLNLERIKFEGFDGNNDQHYHFLRFLVEKAGRYEEYKGTYINSHSSFSLGKYRKMLVVYRQFIEANDYTLNLVGLKEIIASIV